MDGLKNNRVLITGGAGGIGQATARRFLKEGSQVAILDRDRDALARVKEELPELAGVIRADVSDHNSVASAFEELERILGGLDILINNAGISIRHPFLNITPDEWKEVIDVNLTGVFLVAQQAARLMTERGVITNMGSTNGVMGYPFYADYNASKAGVIELTRSMALELAPRIRVNAVCPGFILTPMQQAEYSEEMLHAFEVKVPLKRVGREIAGGLASR